MNLRNCFTDLGTGYEAIGSTLSGSMLRPSLLTTNPRYFTSLQQKSLLSGLIVRPDLAILSRTLSSHLRCSSKVSDTTIMSSRYVKTFGLISGVRIRSINR